MEQKLKKKPSFFTLKRWNSQNDGTEPSSPNSVRFNVPASALPQTEGAPNFRPNNSSHLKYLTTDTKPKKYAGYLILSFLYFFIGQLVIIFISVLC